MPEPKANPKPEKKPVHAASVLPPMPEEIGGSDKPEPTRYGDWEVNGRCTDF